MAFRGHDAWSSEMGRTGGGLPEVMRPLIAHEARLARIRAAHEARLAHAAASAASSSSPLRGADGQALPRADAGTTPAAKPAAVGALPLHVLKQLAAAKAASGAGDASCTAGRAVSDGGDLEQQQQGDAVSSSTPSDATPPGDASAAPTPTTLRAATLAAAAAAAGGSFLTHAAQRSRQAAAARKRAAVASLSSASGSAFHHQEALGSVSGASAAGAGAAAAAAAGAGHGAGEPPRVAAAFAVVYRFQEGYSNAVRRPVTLADFE